jgi:hypothetical protein
MCTVKAVGAYRFGVCKRQRGRGLEDMGSFLLMPAGGSPSQCLQSMCDGHDTEVLSLLL